MGSTILESATKAATAATAKATEYFIQEPAYINVLKTATPYVHSLRNLIWDPNYLPFSIISTLHAIRVALNYRYQFSKTYDRPQVPWLKGLITHLLMSLGGGITSTIIFGRHVSWLASNTTVPLYTIVYFLVLYSPYDIVFRLLMLILPIIKPLLVISDATNSGFGISTNLDVIRYGSQEPLKSSYVAMIICGTIGSCGGGILTDLFSLNQHNWALKTPNFVSKVPLTIKGPFFLSIFYLLSTTPDLHPSLEWIRYIIPSLDHDQAQAIVTSAFITLHLTLEYVYGPLFKFEDISKPVEISKISEKVGVKESITKKGEEAKKKK